jgi:hypothetical protein
MDVWKQRLLKEFTVVGVGVRVCVGGRGEDSNEGRTRQHPEPVRNGKQNSSSEPVHDSSQPNPP